MQVNAILGVDISKKKFDVCLLVDSKKRHKVFQNNQDGFAKLVVWCNGHGANLTHLCLEATIVFSKMNDKFPLWYYQPKVVSLYIYALKV